MPTPCPFWKEAPQSHQQTTRIPIFQCISEENGSISILEKGNSSFFIQELEEAFPWGEEQLPHDHTVPFRFRIEGSFIAFAVK